MHLHSPVIAFLTVIYVLTTMGIIVGFHKLAEFYQKNRQCTLGAARRAALMVALPIWIINTLAVLGFVSLFLRP
jgi:hypothetical protein